MTFSSGVYSLPESAFVFDTVISETAVNSNFSDMATALSACLLKDGTQKVTANLPMANYKHTGLGVGSAATDSANLGQIQASAFTFQGTDSGSADTYVIALTPAITTQAAGLRVAFVAANASTGPSTLNAGGGADAIEYQGAALGGAEIKVGATIVCEHDGTAWQMVSPSDLLGTGTQTQGDVLDDLNTTGPVGADSEMLVGTGAGAMAWESGATLRTSIGCEAADADILKADINKTLTAGYAGTDDAEASTYTTGTYTPVFTGGNFKTLVHGAGAFTIGVPAETSTIISLLTNASASGSITTSGYDTVSGDDIDNTGTNKFILYHTRVGGNTHLHVVADSGNA